MSGFLNNDGSELVGGQLPSGAGQALQLDNSGNLKTTATLSAAANQRVNAQSGDFVAGSIVDLATLAAIVSGNKAAIKAASGDLATGSIVDLATLLTLAGTSGDANTVASFMGRFTKIRDLLSTFAYDNTNELKVSLYGTNATGGDTALGINASGNLKTNINGVSAGVEFNSNLNQVLGAALSATNPLLVADRLQTLTDNGQVYQISSGLLPTATNNNLNMGVQLYNNNQAKNCRITSIQVVCSNAGTGTLAKITASDASLTNSLTPLNLDFNSGNSSLMTAASSPTGATASATGGGTIFGTYGYAASTMIELLTNGRVILLPASSGGIQGIEILVFVTTAGNKWGITIAYEEY